MIILNFTRNMATKEQQLAGVININKKHFNELQKILTFEEIPDMDEMVNRAHDICKLIEKEIGGTTINCIMIGGDQFFMSTLESIIDDWFDFNIQMVYSFSKKYKIETLDKNRNIIADKTITKHVGFVKV